MKGRPRKPLPLHLLEGTYRHNEHGDRTAAPIAGGLPSRPSNLGRFGNWLWKILIPQFVSLRTAGEIDSVALAEACRWYHRYRTEMARGDIAVADRCFRHVDRLLARYGWTTADREKLHDPGRFGKPDAATGPLGIVPRVRKVGR